MELITTKIFGQILINFNMIRRRARNVLTSRLNADVSITNRISVNIYYTNSTGWLHMLSVVSTWQTEIHILVFNKLC